MKRRVLITGATGDTGRAAVSKSIRRGLDVRAMVRTQDKRSAALEALGAKVVVGDLLQIDSILQAMEGVDRAYLAYPVHPGVIEATVNFAQAAKEAGVDKGILRLPVGNARHAPIAAADQGRVIAAILENPEGHAGQTYPLFGPVEMNHEQMAAELTLALGRQIVFRDLPIDEYCTSIAAMGVPALCRAASGRRDGGLSARRDVGHERQRRKTQRAETDERGRFRAPAPR
jgi:NAD(P)H dehydrogenase (quinone)